MSIINILINSIVQIIMFSAIPFILWLLFWRKKVEFSLWLGFKKPFIKKKFRFGMIFVLTVILLSAPAVLIVPYFIDVSILATNQFYGQGANALIPAFIYAFIQTSLSEELLFRGYLTKRLINKFGFHFGNVIQSLLFGLLHGILFISIIGIIGTFFVITFTCIAGWLMGWINEKESDGSIVSSWLLHGIVNYLTAIYAMFLIF